LTPENAGEAVGQVAPFGLDVSSGVEAAPGRKDAAKVAALIASAKGSSAGVGLWAGC
jgi:phosphoribosylanthranilate isomerase